MHLLSGRCLQPTIHQLFAKNREREMMSPGELAGPKYLTNEHHFTLIFLAQESGLVQGLVTEWRCGYETDES
jgi:hypothetical protein